MLYIFGGMYVYGFVCVDMCGGLQVYGVMCNLCGGCMRSAVMCTSFIRRLSFN